MQKKQIMATMQLLNNLISVTERMLKPRVGYHSFGPGGNRDRCQHHGRGGNMGHCHLSKS
eukprot:10454032-Ditylum_brightwellii.AAC.1